MENKNSCCFVAKINEVREIKGADNIELVVAGGWNAITKKGELCIGSLAVGLLGSFATQVDSARWVLRVLACRIAQPAFLSNRPK